MHKVLKWFCPSRGHMSATGLGPHEVGTVNSRRRRRHCEALWECAKSIGFPSVFSTGTCFSEGTVSRKRNGFSESFKNHWKIKQNHDFRAMNGYGSPPICRGGPVQKVALPREHVENPWKNEGFATAVLHYSHLVPTAE